MAFTTYFNFAKPPWKTVRYDEELNDDMDLIEAALLGFPSSDPPGHTNNYPDVTPTDGMKWTDTGNDELKIYYNSTWNTIHSF